MTMVTLLRSAADEFGARVAVGSGRDAITYHQLWSRACGVATMLRKADATGLVLVDVGSEAVPVALFGAALAGVPYIPINYRLSDEQIRSLLVRTAPTVAVIDPEVARRIGRVEGVEAISRADLLAIEGGPSDEPSNDGDGDTVAMLLFTSGTTGEPKAAMLRNRHLVAHVEVSTRAGGAGVSEASLVAAPPYHMAGAMSIIGAVRAGRRLVFLPQFDPDAWIDIVNREQVTHAMTVPTMLVRILDALDRRGATVPSLRNMTYGGGRMPVTVLQRAMERIPDVNWINSYGLTETSSAIAFLTPKDHRDAFASDDPTIRARLGSVGRPIRTVELEIRDDDGNPVASGVPGHIWVRGAQVSGEYAGRASAIAADGWLQTRDGGWLDEDGFLFIEGRLDDTIIRGGENISPVEIEDALLAHVAVNDAAVVGVPDPEWGERIVAVVVLEPDHDVTPEELVAWTRSRLRASKTPSEILVRESLPYSDIGKLLRRVVKAELVERPGTTA
jgi:acyl-CoA synthetase (AMP-forming)/AMP-acid ligase II